ncbi:MAG TPA: hypothetical protein PKE69_15355 [Pyrinomonadaceae bacterium]|nr:hypothetical protein [Pyrinomonadaceae bacterium]
MCGEAFWKRVTAFCLAFGLGSFVSNAFKSEEIRMQIVPDFITSAPQKENCVPADRNLKYRRLEEVSKEDLKNIEAEKDKSETQPQLFIPERDLVEHKTLLHKENCFDSDGRK